MVDLRAPHTATPAELKARIEAERAGAPFLLYRDGDGHQSIVFLADAKRLTVGRTAANGCALPWDTETSRVHAELTLMGAEWTIADEGLSRNGTYVNGQRVQGRRRLRDGDLIVVGRTQIVFRWPLAPALEETESPSDAHAAPVLSPAQRRVLIALCRPLKDATAPVMPASNKQIAAELGVGVDAVKANLRALFVSLGVEDAPQNRKRARLVELAFKTGAVSLRDL
ncbi:MAG TPA: FHA domain-containing protein [Solirubrobacteraceae bacterium]|nr:FHA domain-containing protein [Solirubrobacteraceae bacterium]